MAEVSTRNSANECWTTIRGEVYDLTAWVNQHPGGRAAILRLCGTDGTTAFQAQHDGQFDPEDELRSLFIGKLAL